MAHELHKQLDTYGPEERLAKVSFTTAGTGAPTVTDAQGVVSVARTGVGVFVVTFKHGGQAYCPTYGVEFSTTAQAALITAKSTSAKTITFTVVTAAGGTAADTTGMTIHVQNLIRLQN